MLTTLKPDSNGFYHPTTFDEIRELVTTATRAGHQLRVRGAMHSVESAIVTDNFGSAGSTGINLKLDKLGGVSFGAKEVTAQAGCHLGEDPMDPEAPKIQQGLLFQMDQKGYALPDLGGITHQTVSGFLSTGSSGGSLKYAVEDQISGFTLMDAQGEIHKFTRSDDEFYAAGVSMGLLGVILEVKFDLSLPRFCISGTEAITTTGECEIDLFGTGANSKPGLEQFLRDTDYTRLMWWPQRHVDKMVVWKASRVPCDDKFKLREYREVGDSPFNWAAIPADDQQLLIKLMARLTIVLVKHATALNDLMQANRKQFKTVFSDFTKRLLSELVAHRKLDPGSEFFASLISESLQVIIDLYFTLLGNRDVKGSLAQKIFQELFESEAKFQAVWSPLLMNWIFVVDDQYKAGDKKNQPQFFQDYWYTGLPMDNQMSDLLMPTAFTELWIPIGQTPAVMSALKKFYDGGGYERTGTYACEIYGARQSKFWLSPAYGQDVIRMDIFWFARNAEQPDTSFFPKFWDVLKQFNFRPHWGKHLPPGTTGQYGFKVLRDLYPKWDDFMALREKMDPNQTFVNDYWRNHLGIPSPRR